MIKTVFFDVDGTLLSHKSKSVPNTCRKSLELLKEAKIDRVIATGRHKLELNDLPVADIEFDAYITLNGQLCLDASGNIFYENPLKNTKEIIELFNSKEIPVMLVEKDELYINFINEDVVAAQNAISSLIPPVKEYSGNSVYQAIIYVKEEEQKDYERRLGNFQFTRWDHNAVDVVSVGSSKVSGIKAYLKTKGYEIDESMAFGDGENDLEMLEYCSIGVAMGNANEEVKKRADYVTEDIDDNGILNGLKHYHIID